MKTKTKLFQLSQVKTLAGIFVLLSLVTLSGCQFLQNSAKDLRGAVDQTVGNAQGKIEELRNTVNKTTDTVQQSYNDTKASVDEKVNQVKEAGEKIDQARQALKDANEAVEKVTN